MATWSGDQTASKGLGEEDLGALFEALHPVSKKYNFFGLQIGVTKSEIEKIEAQHSDLDNRLLEILSVRLKNVKAITWNDIDKALRSGCVGESKVADGIRENYSHLFSYGQEHDNKRRKKKEKRGEYTRRHSERSSDRQEEDSDGEVSGREALRTKPKKSPETHLSSSEKESKVKKVRETVEKSSTRHKEREIPEEGNGKNKNERSTKVTSAQSECREKVQKERKGKIEKESSIKESNNETLASSSGEETVNLPFQGEVREKADKPKMSARENKSELVEPKKIKEKNQHIEKHTGASDEKRQYSDGEVHETPPHKSNEVESEDGKEIKEARRGKKRMAQPVKEHLSSVQQENNRWEGR
ncbi:hypothetical protein GBAR_LOCUS14707 [Geodia barretti]|uniref:Uncharacterized protein n=1 Tax=Geodia barretti TaxID=519541 RepID=A0AA35WQH6_GEOBA|nr:hypothetical protein GBAR_LOCUS14707 [Geodia barretti]